MTENRQLAGRSGTRPLGTGRLGTGRLGAVRLAPLAVAALIAACQPLPHPFAEDRPPVALLNIRDSAGVSIAPLEGKPAIVASKLGAAMASALLRRDIPASEKTTSRGSYLLYGRVGESRPRDGKSTVTALWRLYDSRGRILGERRARVEAKTGDWQSASDAVIGRLATAAADELAPLLLDEASAKPTALASAMPAPTPSAKPVAPPPPGAPPGAPPGDNRVRVMVGKVSGAPGDGATSLAAAVTSVLRRQDLAIVTDGKKADLRVEAEITITPVKPDKQHVKIVWRVRRADGVEIGSVGQENDVPRGLLDGPWGDVAFSVASDAGDGLAQLVARGAPARKS